MGKPNHQVGTRVALYLRRSTEDHQEESLETQRSNATQYCNARGWIIADEYVDDAVSRAEFKKRPGLIRMLNAAAEKHFELVITRDENRLGGDQFRVGLMMQDLGDQGVGIVYYFTDELVSIDGAVDKFLVAARNFASELEREKISQRTHEHLLKKAKAGKPAGGISYGYAIVDGHYVINEPQASVVRRIFEMYVSGVGQRSIARQLNDEGIASPRAGKRGTGSWAPSAIRAILTNPRYVGRARYNQTQKLYRGGTKVRDDRPLKEHVSYETPAIVGEQLWSAAETRFKSNRGFGKTKTTKGPAPRYLLTGLARCQQCGGPITVARRKSGQVNTNVYVCSYQHHRGQSVCTNTTKQPVLEVDAAVIDGVRELITPDIVRDVLKQLRTILQERLAAAPSETEKLTLEASKLRREIDRLTAALAVSDDPPDAIVQAIAQRSTRLRQVDAQLATMQASLGTVDLELRRLEKDAGKRLHDLQDEFQRSPERAKAVLTSLVGKDKLRFVPVDGRYRVRGPLYLHNCFASPAGFENQGPDPQAIGITQSSTIARGIDASSSAQIDALGQSVGNLRDARVAVGALDPIEEALTGALLAATQAAAWNTVRDIAEQLVALRTAGRTARHPPSAAAPSTGVLIELDDHRQKPK